MLVRETNKKLANVSIITLKKFGKKFEVAVCPNKMFQYRHNVKTPLNTILHSENIYKSLATGDICSENDLSLFYEMKNQPDGNNSTNINSVVDIIHFILQNGHEQKPQETSQHELSNVEKQIVDLVQSKVLYNGSYVSNENLILFIRKVWNIKNSEPKKQVSGIIKKLEEIGFERVSFKVKLEGEIEMENVIKVEDGVIVKSDVLPDLIEYCEMKGIKYVVTRLEEVESEEIC
jgi:ribosome maturation protein SDO1